MATIIFVNCLVRLPALLRVNLWKACPELAEGLVPSVSRETRMLRRRPRFIGGGVGDGGASPAYPIGLLLRVGWTEARQHRVVLGVEGLQLRVLGFSGSSQDGVCKPDAM